MSPTNTSARALNSSCHLQNTDKVRFFHIFFQLLNEILSCVKILFLFSLLSHLEAPDEVGDGV